MESFDGVLGTWDPLTLGKHTLTHTHTSGFCLWWERVELVFMPGSNGPCSSRGYESAPDKIGTDGW